MVQISGSIIILSENNYLINKEILDCFDFRKFLNKTRVLSSNVIIEMDSMLKQFFKFSKTLDTSKIKEVIKYFMIYELDYLYNELENSFESINREITLKECLINILSDVGAPVDANSLFAMCESQYPTIQCSVDIIRRICLKEPDFIYFGRSSVYGLSVWEKSKNLKGGTIRELVFEFLYNQKKPQSFYAITNYVNNFRKTNLRSVKSNIQLDNSGRFIVRNGYISLSDWEK